VAENFSRREIDFLMRGFDFLSEMEKDPKGVPLDEDGVVSDEQLDAQLDAWIGVVNVPMTPVGVGGG
jgi:hypothetical protein